VDQVADVTRTDAKRAPTLAQQYNPTVPVGCAASRTVKRDTPSTYPTMASPMTSRVRR